MAKGQSSVIPDPFGFDKPKVPDAGGGGFQMPGIGTMFAAASFGLDIAQMFMPDPVAEQRAYNEAYDREMNRFALEQRNRQRDEIFQQTLAMVTDQLELNVEAAWGSWTSEQIRLNEVYDKAAFASQAMLKQLVQVQGRAAAGERYGKSAERMASIETLGGYGRSRAQLARQLTSETTATARRMKKTHRSLHIANERALAQVANAPVMEFMPETPFTDFTPSPLQTGLKIAGAGIGAGMAGYDLTPAGDTFFGFTKG